MRKPNSTIVLLYSFRIIHPRKQNRSVQPFCFWGEHSKGLSNQADVELDMINAISAADIAFIMSSSQAIVNWLNALDQSDFSQWVWCIIIFNNNGNRLWAQNMVRSEFTTIDYSKEIKTQIVHISCNYICLCCNLLIKLLLKRYSKNHTCTLHAQSCIVVV